MVVSSDKDSLRRAQGKTDQGIELYRALYLCGSLMTWRNRVQILPRGVDRSCLWSSEFQIEAVEMEKIDLWSY